MPSSIAMVSRMERLLTRPPPMLYTSPQRGMPVELAEEAGDVARVDLVTHLLPFVAVDGVLLAFHGGENDVRQVAVQLDGGMLRTSQTAAAKDSDRHLEVPAELLAHHIGRDFGSSEDRMQALVDGQLLVDAVAAAGVLVAGLLLDEREAVRPVAVHLVGAGRRCG